MRLLIILVLVTSMPAQQLEVGHSLNQGSASYMAKNFQAIIADASATPPQLWVDSHATCDPPGGVYDIDIVLPTVSVIGLQNAINTWSTDPDEWERIRVPPALLNSSSYSTFADGTKYILLLPAKVGATKCLAIESTTPLTSSQIVCSHGLPGYGGLRMPGCANDIAKMWTLQADSIGTSGSDIIFCPYGCNHYVIRDMELRPKAGAFQSASGVKVNIVADLNGDHLGIERSYIHGWDPGDAGQPAGACSGWSRSSVVSMQIAVVGGVNHYIATWVSGDRFGSDFSDGVHSPGFMQGTVTINGTPQLISFHDPTSTDTSFEVVGPQGGVNVPATMTNPPTRYANGCGDDMRQVQLDCDYCWFEWNYVEKVHWFGNESHSISAGFSNGPYKIAHNWIEAGGGEGYFSGGGPVDQRGGPAGDGEIRGNFFGRDPGYRMLSAGSGHSPHPPFGCGPLDTTASHNTCPMNWSIKNTVEAKLGHRLLFDGNFICGSWPDGQSGYVMLITARTISGGATAGIFDPVTGGPLTAIDNVRISNNWFCDTSQMIQLSTRSLSPGNGGGLSQPIVNLDFINNAATNVGDHLQFGNGGPDIAQWASSTNRYLCNMSRPDGLIAHAACVPISLGNLANPNSGDIYPFPVLDAAFDIGSSSGAGVIRSGGVVTMKLNGLRHDPTVGGTFKIQGFPGWSGSFTITGVLNSGVSTVCSQDLKGNAVAAAIAVNPQPCVRADGTFGDTITYNDAQGADQTLCTTKADCDSKNGGNGIQATLPTLAYKMVDLGVGDNVYTTNVGGQIPNTSCTSNGYAVGSSSAVLAVSPTVITGLDVYYPNPGLVDAGSGFTCELDNGIGLPKNVSWQHNSIFSTNIMSIGSNGLQSQHYNNRFYHNHFVTPVGNNSDLTCGGVGGQGSAVYPCWDPATFKFYDNILSARTLANWTPYPVGQTANATPVNVSCPTAVADATCMGLSGFMSGITFPTSDCTADPCPLQALPWANNFQLSKIAPALSSVYGLEGVNVGELENALTRMQYSCPIGLSCGVTGPKPD